VKDQNSGLNSNPWYSTRYQGCPEAPGISPQEEEELKDDRSLRNPELSGSGQVPIWPLSDSPDLSSPCLPVGVNNELGL
jgi:hypothetical protein